MSMRIELESLTGQTLARGRYTLMSLLGSGGYGAVYAGWDKELERKVAIKLLHARGPGVLERFRREAKLQAKLEAQTSQVVRVYDTGSEQLDGRQIPYIVMEFIDGITLHDMVLDGEDPAPLSPPHATTVLAKLLQVLELASEYKIVHRDIKPANIMLTRSAKGEERVILLDFGVSGLQADEDAPEDSQESSKLTQTGDMIGTRRYMAPECQMDNQNRAPSVKPSHGTDLYALGLTAYVLLTGEEPFKEYGVNALPVVYHLYREGRFEWPRVEVPGHETLAGVVNRLMAFAPEDRYSSAHEALEALLPALSAARSAQVTPAVFALPKPALDIQGLEQTEVAPRTPTPPIRQKNFQSIAPLGDVELMREIERRMLEQSRQPPTPTAAMQPDGEAETPADLPSRRPDRQQLSTAPLGPTSPAALRPLKPSPALIVVLTAVGVVLLVGVLLSQGGREPVGEERPSLPSASVSPSPAAVEAPAQPHKEEPNPVVEVASALGQAGDKLGFALVIARTTLDALPPAPASSFADQKLAKARPDSTKKAKQAGAAVAPSTQEPSSAAKVVKSNEKPAEDKEASKSAQVEAAKTEEPKPAPSESPKPKKPFRLPIKTEYMILD